MSRKLLAVGVVGAAVIVVSYAPVVDDQGVAWVIADALAAAAFLACGLWVWRRRPENAVGPLMIAVALPWALGALGADYESAILQSVGLLFTAAFVLPFVMLLLVYPA